MAMGRRLLLLFLIFAPPVFPQPEDPPEEVARLEKFDYARSPVDNQRLNLGEYAQLETSLQAPEPALPSDKLKLLVILLRIRKLIKSLVPF